MIIEFDIFRPYSDQIIHGVTTKSHGSFNDEQDDFESNLSDFFDDRPVYADQLHGDRIFILSERPDQKPQGDAFITQQAGLPLMVKVADCQGVLFYDPVTKTIAAVHSGWRGSALNIISKTVGLMEKELGVRPENLRMGVSPSLGPCCAEFTDPERELPEEVYPFINDRYVDFWSLSQKQAADAGIDPENIELAGICTQCNPDFYSHRRQDQGRMAVFIALR